MYEWLSAFLLFCILIVIIVLSSVAFYYVVPVVNEINALSKKIEGALDKSEKIFGMFGKNNDAPDEPQDE